MNHMINMSIGRDFGPNFGPKLLLVQYLVGIFGYNTYSGIFRNSGTVRGQVYGPKIGSWANNPGQFGFWFEVQK